MSVLAIEGSIRIRICTPALLGLLAVAVGVLLPGSGVAATWFGSSTTYATGYGPNAIAMGDLNHDGVPDLVTADYFSDSISTLLGTGNGSFPSHTDTYVPGYHYGVAVGYLDADLFADVAVTNFDRNTVSILLGNGDGSFGDPIDLAADAFPASVAIRDLNGDTKNDLIVVNFDDPGSVSIFMGRGDGTFDPKVDYAVWKGPTGLAIEDLDGDSKLDLVTANAGVNTVEHSVSVLLGNGDGTFKTSVPYGTSRIPRAVAVGSFNGDAYPDIVTVGQYDSLSVLLGTGSGQFGDYSNRSVPYGPYSVSVADFDADGKADLSIVREGWGISLFPGNGDGTFGPNEDHTTGLSPRAHVVGDFNGDGLPDLAIADRGDPDGFFGGTTITVYINCVPCASTAVSVTLLESQFLRGAVHLRWATPRANGPMFGTIQRRTENTAWSDLAGPFDLNESVFSYEDTANLSEGRYGYRLSLWDSADRWYSDEAWVSVPREAGAPRVLSLGAPRPNPSGGVIRFAVGVPTEGHARLSIFNAAGRLVATVLDREGPSGWTEMAWDGKDSSGRPVSSGVYLARLEGAAQKITRKFLVTR